jgi:SagB-type dehydrogenase family enzyme
VRQYGRTITAEQLGEFLFRAARVRGETEFPLETAAGLLTFGLTSRPYPSAGALYELELYPVVRACDGLSPGLYHYDPFGHRLEPVAGLTPAVEALLTTAGWATSIPADALQVLFVIAARFPRVGWKYSSLAYALVLKNVGVLYQTLYLTAAAMGLSPCGVGGGDPDAFARAAGTDPDAEPSVGEFLLGGGE